jgi:predicted nucleic acid-binding protein
MMARMNSLEEGFREVIHEMRETIGGARSSRTQSPQRAPPKPAQREKRLKERELEKGKGKPVAVAVDKENIDPVLVDGAEAQTSSVGQGTSQGTGAGAGAEAGGHSA